MRRILVLLISLSVLFGTNSVAGAQAACPNDINIEDAAWVLYRIVSEDKTDNSNRANAWKRTFLYQPDLGKRIRGEYELECVGETYSFVIEGKETVVVKRILRRFSTPVFLLREDNTWAEGSDFRMAHGVVNNSSKPVYVIILFRGASPVEHRIVPVSPPVPDSISIRDRDIMVPRRF